MTLFGDRDNCAKTPKKLVTSHYYDVCSTGSNPLRVNYRPDSPLNRLGCQDLLLVCYNRKNQCRFIYILYCI